MNRRWLWTLILAVAALATATVRAAAPAADEIPAHRAKQIRDAAPEKARVTPQKPRRVLIWNTPLMEKSPHKGYCIPYGTAAMRALGEKTGAYEPVVSDDLAMLLPEKIKSFDAIVLNNADGPWITPTDAAMERLKAAGADKAAVEQVLRKSLLDYVSGGGGIMAYHFAIGGNTHWPEYREMLGAAYSGHPWNEEVGVKLDEPDHPLVAAFAGKGFRIAEEIFQFREPYSRKNVRVLLSLDTATTNMTVQWIERKDGDFALAWVRPHGKGRVFYTAFGHRTETFWNPAILQFYLDGIQFATGDLAAPR
ncbi:MAG: ThuA domain-containing protein [Planctomycetes bacterium]|nr:ThuA domain-containing protein [Planctomycetota bacterium]